MEDLIRRSDAIKAVEECLKLLARPRYTVKTAIEAIPSVDIPHSDEWDKYSDKLWKNAYERGKADRPQGEWIDYIGYDLGIKGQWLRDDGKTVFVQCDQCDSILVRNLMTHMNFCPNCGARMKGADDYERAIEQMEHDTLYEPTYNSEDGSM